MLTNRLAWPSRLLTVVAILVILSGCSSARRAVGGSGDARGDLADAISVTYDRRGDPGYIDQALVLQNASELPLVLSARLELLDASGAVLRGVTAHGVYGATRGGQVLVPGETLDFLVFEGADARKVRDVRLAGVTVEPVDFPRVADVVEAVPLDDAGRELEYPARFASVALRNPNADAVRVRVVSIVWNRPPEGQTQQAHDVVHLSEVVEVPANGERTIAVSTESRRLVDRYALSYPVSLKAYFAA
jgi:hypothetical protein